MVSTGAWPATLWPLAIEVAENCAARTATSSPAVSAPTVTVPPSRAMSTPAMFPPPDVRELMLFRARMSMSPAALVIPPTSVSPADRILDPGRGGVDEGGVDGDRTARGRGRRAGLHRAAGEFG